MEYTIGSRVLDGWEIVQQIGVGSYGKVFKVTKSNYGIVTFSALKIISIPESQADVRSALSDGMDERSATSYFKGFVDNLLHEIAIMSSVKSHPNIVSYEDHHLEEYPNEIRWDILIRMELLTPLNQYRQDKTTEAGLSSGGMLPVAEAVRLGREISSALAFCQRKNIIHRDVKPENILISEAGQFKLGDFGVAKTTSVHSTSGSHKGTDRYMAPEVFLNQPYGPTVDVYSLGLVMYRLLNNGRLPFLPPAPRPLTFGDYEDAQMKRMRGDTVPPPADADEDLASIVLKACAFQSKDRWRSAGELQTALDEYVQAHNMPQSPEEESSREKEWYEEFMSEARKDDSYGLPAKPQEGTVGGGWRQEAPREETVGGGWRQEAPQEGTVGGGWRQEEPQEGTVGGGWRQEEPQEGTVGGGWKDSDKLYQEALHRKQDQKAAAPKTPPSREELVHFWQNRIPIIAIQGQMRYCYVVPETIPASLAKAALERTHDPSGYGSMLAMISLRANAKSSLFEGWDTYGAKFWGLYFTETGFGLLGKKKSDAVSNVIRAEYREVKDAKVLRDDQVGFHKLKLLLEGDRIVIFSPEVSRADHYNYNALCDALLEMRNRFR